MRARGESGQLLESQESVGKDTLYQVLPAWATEGDMKALRIRVRGPHESRMGCVGRGVKAEATLALLLVALGSGPKFGDTAF